MPLATAHKKEPYLEQTVIPTQDSACVRQVHDYNFSLY